MEKASKYISKKVISIDDGNLVGYVLNIIFDNNLKTFEGLIVIDEESENSFILEKKNILAVGEDCVMIENALVMKFDISSLSNNPIGKIVYDRQGNMLGRVMEVEILGKNVKKIITNKCEIPQRLICKSGDNFLIYGKTIKNKKNKSFNQQIGESDAVDLPLSFATIKAEPELKQAENQARLFANSNILIGRMVSNDILGLNNELIANKFDIIDKNIVNKARKHNKLNLLAYYSK